LFTRERKIAGMMRILRVSKGSGEKRIGGGTWKNQAGRKKKELKEGEGQASAFLGKK